MIFLLFYDVYPQWTLSFFFLLLLLLFTIRWHKKNFHICFGVHILFMFFPSRSVPIHVQPKDLWFSFLCSDSYAFISHHFYWYISSFCLHSIQAIAIFLSLFSIKHNFFAVSIVFCPEKGESWMRKIGTKREHLTGKTTIKNYISFSFRVAVQSRIFFIRNNNVRKYCATYLCEFMARFHGFDIQFRFVSIPCDKQKWRISWKTTELIKSENNTRWRNVHGIILSKAFTSEIYIL